MKLSTALLVASAFMFFCMFDAVTTIACYEHLRTFDYETSEVLRGAYTWGGLYGFMGVKILASIVCFALVAYVLEAYPALYYTGSCLLLGAGAAGLFVGFSNLNVVFNGWSFYLGGFDSNVLSILIILSSLIIGVSVDVLRAIRERGSSVYQ